MLLKAEEDRSKVKNNPRTSIGQFGFFRKGYQPFSAKTFKAKTFGIKDKVGEVVGKNLYSFECLERIFLYS